MRDGTSGLCELSLKYRGISCRCCTFCHCVHYLSTCNTPLLWIREINVINGQNGRQKFLDVDSLLNVASHKRAGSRACGQNKACIWFVMVSSTWLERCRQCIA
jgi:hypothetical protein